MCDKCMVTYGSCALFKSYELQVQTLNTPALRNDVLPPALEIVGEPEKVNEFVGAGTYIAPKSTETLPILSG